MKYSVTVDIYISSSVIFDYEQCRKQITIIKKAHWELNNTRKGQKTRADKTKLVLLEQNGG